MAFTRCKNLEETKLRVMQLIALSNESTDKVGREIEAQEKTFAVWMFMDEDTKALSETKELVEGKSPFAAVCDFLEIPLARARTGGPSPSTPSSRRPCAWTSARSRPRTPQQLQPPQISRSPSLDVPRQEIDSWMPSAIPKCVINVKEKDTGTLNAHHTLE